jgi:hypothetical protein
VILLDITYEILKTKKYGILYCPKHHGDFEVPLLAPEKSCLVPAGPCSSGFGEELSLLPPDKICLFWLRTTAAPFGSRRDLPLLVPDKTFLFWLKRRSASSGSGQDLPLLAEVKSFLFFNAFISFAKF